MTRRFEAKCSIDSAYFYGDVVMSRSFGSLKVLLACLSIGMVLTSQAYAVVQLDVKSTGSSPEPKGESNSLLFMAKYVRK